jgi:hypothetical protein
VKIIGVTDTAYIVEMTPSEVRHLTGDTRTEPDAYSGGRAPHAGFTGARYDLHATLGNCRRVMEAEAELKRSAEALRGLASVLERTAPQLPPVQEAQS